MAAGDVGAAAAPGGADRGRGERRLSEGDTTDLPPALDGAADTLPERLARAIALTGPMPVSAWMRAANDAYYARGHAIGTDFVTAPEVSQMFGELVGAWCADLWARAGRPEVAWVELGPGRGTLAADARRAMRQAGLDPPIHLVERSPALAAQQAERVPGAVHHADLSTLPADRPLLVIANEFLDALPIEQLVRGVDGWRRRLVACQDTLFVPIAGPPVPSEVVPPPLADAPPGSLFETAPAAVAAMRMVARALVRQGGAALFVDYGYEGPALGETLQAVRRHDFAAVFAEPGAHDLSALVDWTLMRAAAAGEGATTHGPASQRDVLGRLGLATRAAALARAAPARAEAIAGEHARLTGEEAMGTRFAALALTAPAWPEPAGFA